MFLRLPSYYFNAPLFSSGLLHYHMLLTMGWGLDVKLLTTKISIAVLLELTHCLNANCGNIRVNHMGPLISN